MKLLLKFVAGLLIGFLISRTERPIHQLEKGIAGNEGVSDWYLIMRYVIGTGALYTMLVIMLAEDESLKCVLMDSESPLDDRLDKVLYIVGMSALSGAVAVGSGVGLGFLKNSWEDLG